MKASELKVGDLVKVRYKGLATIMKFWAPACVGVVLLEGKDAGKWMTLRGLDFDEAEKISKGW